MAGQGGLEPTTSGFGDRHSAKLSYWPVKTLAFAKTLPITSHLPTNKHNNNRGADNPPVIILNKYHLISRWTVCFRS